MSIPGNWLRDNEFMAPPRRKHGRDGIQRVISKEVCETFLNTNWLNEASKPEGKINMVDNQHRKIKGYRELTEDEIEVMNEIKRKGIELGELCEKLGLKTETVVADQRWLAIGRTHLQQGLMALTRAVAKPDFF